MARTERQRSLESQDADAPAAKRARTLTSSSSLPSVQTSSSLLSNIDQNLGLPRGGTVFALFQFFKFTDNFLPMDDSVKGQIMKTEFSLTDSTEAYITPNPSGSDFMYQPIYNKSIEDKNLPTYRMKPIAVEIGVGNSTNFNIAVPNPSKCIFFFNKECMENEKIVYKNSFELKSFNEFVHMLGAFVPVNGLASELMPQFIADMCTAVTIENLQFSVFKSDFPCLSMDVKYDFPADHWLSKALSFESITCSIKLTLGEKHSAIDICISLSFQCGFTLVGKRTNDQFTLSLQPDATKPLTFNNLAQGMAGIQDALTKSGVQDLSDPGGTGPIKDITLVFDANAIYSLMIGVESTFKQKVGSVQFSDPYVFLNIKNPLSPSFREIDLGLGFDLSVGSLKDDKKIKVIGLLRRSPTDGKLEGQLGAIIMGTVKVKDVFDLEGEDLSIEVPGINLEVAEIGIKNPFFAFDFRELTFEIGWNGMSIKVGGTSELDLHMTLPTGLDEITNIHLKYIKDDGSGNSIKRLETDFSLSGEDNFVADGIKLLGPMGESIVERNPGPITLAIEKPEGEGVRFFMPEGLVPPTITFGGENGLELRDTVCFIEPAAKMNFGVEGSLTVNMLGKPIVFTGGLSILPPRGFEGTLSVDGDFQIGAHVVVNKFGINLVAGLVPEGGGFADFSLYDKPGKIELVLGFTPPPAFAPFPTRFILHYPGELTVIGLIEAFLGESNFTQIVPDELGEIVKISGTPIEGGNGAKNDLRIIFDIYDVEFDIDW